MDRLHAYWRMPYLENSDSEPRDPHLFANLPKTKNDRDALILHRGIYTYLVMNKFPYNAGHLLAVPYREVPDLEYLEKNDHRMHLLYSSINLNNETMVLSSIEKYTRCIT